MQLIIDLIEPLLELSKGLLTPVIAIVATYIAWQQWQTNRMKLNLERFERRLHVYEEVLKILITITGSGKVSEEELTNFQISVSEAAFLFGSEIPKYIDEICQHGSELWICKQERLDDYQEKPDGYNHKEIIAKEHEERKWFREQFEPAKEMFSKYLDISK